MNYEDKNLNSSFQMIHLTFHPLDFRTFAAVVPSQTNTLRSRILNFFYRKLYSFISLFATGNGFVSVILVFLLAFHTFHRRSFATN